MKRTPLARRTPLRSGKPLARKARLAPTNRERRKALRLRQFGDVAALVRYLPCAVCSAPGPNHPHHVRSRGAGGTSEDLVSLCADHHDEVHRIGRRTFAERYAIDLEEVAGLVARAAAGPAG